MGSGVTCVDLVPWAGPFSGTHEFYIRSSANSRKKFSHDIWPLAVVSSRHFLSSLSGSTLARILPLARHFSTKPVTRGNFSK
jgi:hypothetical protein